MERFRIVYKAFPDPISGYITGITKKKKDHYTIMIDSTLSEDHRDQTLKHELSHIVLGHFDNDRSIEDCELEADQHADKMTKEEFADLMTYCYEVVR